MEELAERLKKEAPAEAKSWGEFIKRKRLQKRINLRDFYMQFKSRISWAVPDIAWWSRVERGVEKPPDAVFYHLDYILRFEGEERKLYWELQRAWVPVLPRVVTDEELAAATDLVQRKKYV